MELSNDASVSRLSFSVVQEQLLSEHRYYYDNGRAWRPKESCSFLQNNYGNHNNIDRKLDLVGIDTGDNVGFVCNQHEKENCFLTSADFDSSTIWENDVIPGVSIRNIVINDSLALDPRINQPLSSLHSLFIPENNSNIHEMPPCRLPPMYVDSADVFEKVMLSDAGCSMMNDLPTREEVNQQSEKDEEKENCDPRTVVVQTLIKGILTTEIHKNSTALLEKENIAPKKPRRRRRKKLARTSTADKCSVECKECGQTFAKKAYLTYHMRTHAKVKPYRCHVCDKNFCKNSVLVRHMKIHTERKPYQCAVCLRCFRRNDELMRHAKIHSEEKSYVCGDCGKAFLRKFDLNKHSHVHKTTRRFTCAVCGKSYRQRDGLLYHMRMAHSNRGKGRKVPATVKDSVVCSSSVQTPPSQQERK